LRRKNKFYFSSGANFTVRAVFVSGPDWLRFGKRQILALPLVRRW
jgi:hypothetical protein